MSLAASWKIIIGSNRWNDRCVYGFFSTCNVDTGRGGVEMHVFLIKREIVDRNRALLKDTTVAIFNAILKLPLIFSCKK